MAKHHDQGNKNKGIIWLRVTVPEGESPLLQQAWWMEQGLRAHILNHKGGVGSKLKWL